MFNKVVALNFCCFVSGVRFYKCRPDTVLLDFVFFPSVCIPSHQKLQLRSIEATVTSGLHRVVHILYFHAIILCFTALVQVDNKTTVAQFYSDFKCVCACACVYV